MEAVARAVVEAAMEAVARAVVEAAMEAVVMEMAKTSPPPEAPRSGLQRKDASLTGVNDQFSMQAHSFSLGGGSAPG
jgi:hypothetical protein